jgi:hypothetical protein
MRIPIWPGVRLSMWEPQNPDAVKVTMACYYKPFRVTRVLSKRGWALLLIRYDWRDTGTYEPPKRDALADTPTPGCSCGHDGMGAAWHERGVCQWLVGEAGR